LRDTITVGPIRPAEAGAARQVIRDVWREVFAEAEDEDVRTYFDRPEALADLDDVATEYVGGAFLVARDGDVVVGTGALRRLDGDTAELKRMFLLPAYRGRGLGLRLAQTLLDVARAGGCRRVRLVTNQRMARSHRLYAGLGFRPIEPYEENPDRPHALFMELTL
jgi:putative acetyltransferase